MRYRQVLFEYVRDKTAERFAETLYKRLSGDSSASWFTHFIMQAERRPDKTVPLKKWVEIACANHFLIMAERADPTSNKSYVMWITTRYISGGIKRCEDIESTCADYLEQYNDIKNSGFFKRTTDEALKPLSDINRLKSLFELRAVLNSIPSEQRISNTAADKKQEQDLIANREAIVYLNSPTCMVVSPQTEKASCYFGRNTQWCTASKRNNMFNSYMQDGQMFIILDKNNNRRWQLHFDSNQFMDENDQEITPEGWGEIPQEALDPDFYEEAIRNCEMPSLIRLSVERANPFSDIATDEIRMIADEDEDDDEELDSDE